MTATPTTGALRSGVSTTRRPLARVKRSIGYFDAGIRTGALRRDTIATLTHGLCRAYGLQDVVGDVVELFVRLRYRHVQDGRLGPADVDQRDRDTLALGLEAGHREVQPELEDPGGPPAERGSAVLDHLLLVVGRVEAQPYVGRHLVADAVEVELQPVVDRGRHVT